MKTIRYYVLSIVAMLLAVNVQAQSLRLDNANLKSDQLILGKTTAYIDCSGFTTVAVAGNCDYTATSDDSWIILRKMANGNMAIFSSPNFNLGEREGTVKFTSANGTVERLLTVIQEGFDATDIQVPIASGEASSYQGGEGIEKSFDGDYSTIYHSNYSGTTYPITLTYNFEKASHIDYAVYTPRQSGTNGNFKEVKIEYKLQGGDFVELTTMDFGGGNNASQISFGSNGIDNIVSVRFTVLSSTSDAGRAFASCAEMTFYERNTYMTDLFQQYFADNLCTTLKSGLTAEQIAEIPVEEIRDAAQQMMAGTYSTEFRLGEFGAFRPVSELRNELKNAHTYCDHENPTGITFEEGETVILAVEGISTSPVSLTVRNFGPEVFASSSYPLSNGINVIRCNNKGNGYINYYTSDWKNAPKVKIHFLNATEQGYFSPKYKGHTNDDWKRLLANAKGDCLDLHGEFIDCVFPVSSYQANCPNDGEWLMAAYDSIVSVERELMGVFKYNHECPNRQCAITVATSAGLYHASNDGFCVPVNALRDPTSRKYFDFWGAAHELGHNNQTKGLTWVGLTEVSNNIMSAYVEHELRTDGYHRLENESNGFRYYNYLQYNVLTGGQFMPHVNGDVFCTLIPFWQLLIYTRIAEIQPSAYPELYETLRTDASVASMTNGQQQVNFMLQWCKITKTNWLPFFKKVGMFKTVDVAIDDYGVGQLTITESMLNTLESQIEAMNYPEPPEAFYFIDVNNYPVFRDKAALEAGTVGAGCVLSGNNVRIQHSKWKNVVGFETYTADGTLIHITNYGHGESAYKPQYTNVVWNTSENPAYIMAVGYDGTRVKCYEP
ncbi:MAG: M60 family metallopeptidase [Prevotella sp.]|nr:M60 family metallopeptidase [Prevotella sp.]